MFHKNKKKPGFSLIELIIVIAIFATLAGTTLLALSFFLSNSSLKNSSDQLLQSLRNAQTNATLRLENSDWGIYLDDDAEPSFILFKGENYAGRDINFDQEFPLPSNLDFNNISLNGGVSEIIFHKRTGETDEFGSFELQETSSNVKTFSINQLGKIDVE